MEIQEPISENINDSISFESKRRCSRQRKTTNIIVKRGINNQRLRKNVNNQAQRIIKKPKKPPGENIIWEWSPSEKKLLFEALKKYGPMDLENIQKAVPSKRFLFIFIFFFQ